MKRVVPISKNIEQASSTEPAALAKRQRRSFREFMRQLKQRRVCRAAITYVLIMWLNLQIADVLTPMIGLPAWTLEVIVIIGAMGFPAALLLAWIFQVTPEGIKIDEPSSSLEQPTVGWLDTVVSMLLIVISLALTILLIMTLVTPTNTVLVQDMCIFAAGGEKNKAIL